METVFIDECGYTGEDLLNSDQPVLVLASLKLSEDACKDYKQRYFSRIRAAELKHTSLARRSRQQQMVIDFISGLADHNSAVDFYIAHKKYVLVTKIVDWMIEPLAYNNGYDLYHQGTNITLSNEFYCVIPSLMSMDFFDDFLSRFQSMMRRRTRKSYDQFFKIVLADQYPEKVDHLFDYLKYYHLRGGYRRIKTLPTKALEVSDSCAFTMMGSWSEKSSDDLCLIHDNSRNMLEMRSIWEKIWSADIEEMEVGHDRRRIRFPLRIAETRIEDSKDWAGLQLVDVLAGAMVRCLRWIVNGRPANDTYAQELAAIILSAFPGHSMWPTPRVTPEELDTTGEDAGDVLELITSLLTKEPH
ncbi:MAG: DUF3800 domain-containing protein [Proteobacteria bacterium]|nr:DUF3800 domain-containing protein [Pseudomonadota bacterium]